jgi:HEAT repeat protein
MNPGNSQETYEALKHIGAPAAALLVQALTQTNSAPKDPNFLASYVRQNAFAALEQMGPSAKSQVPELIGLLKHDDKNVRIWATLVLADMGPAAKAAVPALKEESQDTNYAAYAKEALRRIGP